MFATEPVLSPTPTHVIRAKRSYSSHWPLDNKELTAGSGVYDTDCICPPSAPDNTNLFANTFGIEFDDGSDSLVWPVSAFGFVSAFGLDREIIYSLYHPANFSHIDSNNPQRKSSAFLSALTN